MQCPHHPVGEPAKKGVIRIIAGRSDCRSVEGNDAIGPQKKAIQPRRGRWSVPVNTENPKIFVAIDVADPLHLDYELEMGAVLREDRCTAVLLHGRKNPSKCA